MDKEKPVGLDELDEMFPSEKTDDFAEKQKFIDEVTAFIKKTEERVNDLGLTLRNVEEDVLDNIMTELREEYEKEKYK